MSQMWTCSMPPKRCLLDMDGVIVDFLAGMVRLHGRPNPYLDPTNHGKFFNTLWGMSHEECWGLVDAAGVHFWEHLPKTPDADQIVDMVVGRFGVENTAILTSPKFGGTACIEGKSRWIKAYYPDLLPNMIFTSAKQFCANQESVLVDDQDNNVNAFLAGGGQAVLVPGKWNQDHELTHMLPWIVESKLNYLMGADDDC